jgi:hydroxyisourate hydrolase
VAGTNPTISTHVLDLAGGEPAAGVGVALFRLTDDGRPELLSEQVTGADGRIPDLLGGAPLIAGDYQLAFDVGGYADEPEPFFQSVALALHVTDASHSYHVPLLLSPFGVTSYRGS